MLTIWKRHSPTCLKTAPLVKLAVEQRRFYKKCQCACWVTGTHPETGEYIKRSLDTTSWEAGERLVLRLHTTTPRAAEKQRITIEEAFQTWFADKRRLLVGTRTIDGPYASLKLKVLAYAKERGISLLSQLDKDETYKLIMSPLWGEWKASTGKRQMATLREFFRFAIDQEWTSQNPLAAVKATRANFIQVEPYTASEEDILEAAFGAWLPDGNNAQWSRWGQRPATLYCLTHVLQDTGLRISDALRVRPAIVRVLPSGDGECTLTQTKKDNDLTEGGEVTVYLKPATLAEMARVPWVSPKYPFLTESEFDGRPKHPGWKKHLHAECKKVYHAMQAVGNTVGVACCRPHRYRHTFAVKHLINGKSLEKVSRLLGHNDIQTTAKYYAKWTDDRQDRLRDEIIADRQRERGAVPISTGRRKSARQAS